MILAEILEIYSCSRNLRHILPLHYTIVKVVFQVLQLFIPLDMSDVLEIYNTGLYFIYELIAFNWISYMLHGLKNNIYVNNEHLFSC